MAILRSYHGNRITLTCTACADQNCLGVFTDPEQAAKGAAMHRCDFPVVRVMPGLRKTGGTDVVEIEHRGGVTMLTPMEARMLLGSLATALAKWEQEIHEDQSKATVVALAQEWATRKGVK